MAKVDWDQSKVDDARAPMEVLPRGKYPTVITTSTEKPTKNGKGKFWEFEFEVVKGDFKGRKLWSRLNVYNDSEVAQRIGREQFKSLAKAAGKESATTTEALHGKYVVCNVSIEKGDRGDMNRIDQFISPAEFKESGAEAPTKAAAAKAGAVDDDDIPF